MKNVIGVFDSGIGGLTTKAEIERLIPQARVLFYGDSANCPYGNRPQSELIEITSKVVEGLEAQGAELIVIACNTATTQCIHALRKRFPRLTFIGTEPAIKVACDNGCKNILLMATPSTIESLQVQRLLNKHVSKQHITLLPCFGLADTIEQEARVSGNNVTFRDANLILQKLDQLLSGIPGRDKIDGVILGCTHYIHIRPEIQKYFPNARLFDGNHGVAKHTRNVFLQD